MNRHGRPCWGLALLLLAGCPLPAAAESSAVAAELGGTPARNCPAPVGNGHEEWTGQGHWQSLERAGYRLGELVIRVDDVFVGSSLNWFERLANRLHIDSDPEAVRALLTIEGAQSVEAERVYEAERFLRRQPFLTAARIVPLRCEDGLVDAEVRVRDAWTLQLGVGFGSAGGDSRTSFNLEDDNFLGTGKAVQFDWDDDRDRTTREIGYRDPALLGSRWTLSAAYEDNSDGDASSLAVGLPFRRVDQPWGFRVRAEERTTELDFDQASRTAFSAPADSEEASAELRRLIAREGQTGWRAGLGWRREHYEYGPLETERAGLRRAPELNDRRLEGPYVVLERFHDRFQSYRNFRSIGVTEDYSLGVDARLLAGRFDDSLNDTDPWFYGVELQYGLEVGEGNLLRAEASLSGRYRDDGDSAANYRSVSADYYHRTSRRNTVVAHAELDWRDDPDPEDELHIGGFDGLLGYPNRFRVGDRRWRVLLEDRYTSDWVLFNTIQVGYTAFIEAGSIRGLDRRWEDTLADVGVGLRLGSLRSSFGTVSYVAVATPLVDVGGEDDYELVIGSTFSF